MAPSSPSRSPRIDALDFDANRTVRSRASGRRSLLDDDVSLMGEVAEGILERDRRKMRREVIRIGSFACAILSCLCAGSITSYSLYAPQFMTELHYTQLRVNAVSVAAELALYLLVPLFGYICDRYSPVPLSLLASCLFGMGYLLAAFTYKSGPPPDAIHGGTGWPFGIMILAFIGIGAGTSCMYLSAVATCAKNFSQGKHRGLILAMPIAALGLSGMWQSQVGARLLCRRIPSGKGREVDVFRYFLLLGCLLIAVGVIGAMGLRIVDEEELIERKVEELERSGLLEESAFFKPNRNHSSYGTLANGPGNPNEESDTEADANLSNSLLLKRQQEEERLQRAKSLLLNHETRSFLKDRTMWLLAAGFFLLTGPGEAYINNVGTVISSLSSPDLSGSPPAGEASSHVSIIALTSTLARLLTGTLSDLFAPSPNNDPSTSPYRPSFSRLALLLPSAFLQALGFLTLGLPFFVAAHPSLLLLSSTLLGLGYGSSFSLVPIIISVVWGVENFATNWGVVAMMPAGGAAVWSVIYSINYSRASPRDGECNGANCFMGWAWGCAGSVGMAILLWSFAWRSWRRRGVVV